MTPAFITFFTFELDANFLGAPEFCFRPRTVLPRRIVPDMLGMATTQVRHPVTLIVSMKACDFLLHDDDLLLISDSPSTPV